MPSAYLLVAHGSRDPRPQMAMEQLAKLIYQHKLEDAHKGKYPYKNATSAIAILEPLVDVAYLELDPLPLHAQIKQKCDRALACGYDKLQVLPLFLLSGVHVMEDIPQEVAKARQISNPKVTIELKTHLGTQPGLIELLKKQMANTTAEAWILIAHGSRRPSSKAPIEEIARKIGASSAYWAISPSLETQVEKLKSNGYKKIGIVPYFLFAGGITDAILAKVNELKLKFPGINVQLVEPLGASTELANLIINLIE
ncbi:sirohydrochlorin chelatase [Synechocystis sp. PCC 7509]|uniref:sirohydrochlorin chelatase n=1 Tax=Synechocystis sp. PCC 7509 TaxID=927677 RepID=UPI0002AC66A3|nr:sirohydrochlorin chelatase [Synechocystis sp. PCC 7509]